VTAERFGPTGESALAREVLADPAFAFFRWFAMYPALYRVAHGNPSTCVWFQDLRFFTPGRDARMFHYGLCRENDVASRQWRPYELLIDNTRMALF
jgi:inner membrane protein